MILGFEPQLSNILVLGVTLLILLTLQMLVGTRVIKFKGSTHRRVHKWLAWLIYVTAIVHALLALVFANGWVILS